jgi:hypothetical protein
VRAYPYSTEFSVNPLTFGDIAYNPEVHAQGTVWCSMLWEMRQALIARHGFESGRETAERLVVDGLKLMPLAPLFLDGRDSILLADRMTNSGANQDLIWRVFAKRGLGASATTSLLTPNIGFQITAVEAYDVPPEFSGGMLVINDKPPAPAVIGEPLELIVADRDIAGIQSLPVRASNLRTNQEITLNLIERSPGRFRGSLTILSSGGQAGSALTGMPGDTVVIAYENARDAAGQPERIEVRTTVGRRVVVYEEDFEGGAGGWTFPSNSDASRNWWHVTSRKSSSPARSLYFAKEKQSKSFSFSPASSRGLAVFPMVDLTGFLRPRIEFDWLFAGFPGGSGGFNDTAAISGANFRSSPAEPALNLNFNFQPIANSDFIHGLMDLRFVENQRVSLAISFVASNANVNRKQFEGLFIDELRVTAVSTR